MGFAMYSMFFLVDLKWHIARHNMREEPIQMLQAPSLCVRTEQIKGLLADLGRQHEELCREIEAEELRLGLYDPAHFAYSPLAKALRARRAKLEQSIESLKKILEMQTSGAVSTLKVDQRGTDQDQRSPSSERAVRARRMAHDRFRFQWR